MEYIKAKKNKVVKNLVQAKEDVVEFSRMQYDMANEMNNFDERWQST